MKVTIDDITIDVPAGTTILQAARQISQEVAPPAMCYYTSLADSGGKCRTCLVEVSAGSAADPRPMPKLVPSCRTTVMDGMVVKNTTSPRVKQAREGVVEFLLLNHPLDCPVCDQAGECKLQDLGFEHGKAETKTDFKRRTYPSRDIGPYIQLHMNRCILCYRCTFVADQLTPERVHGVLNRGDHSEISTHIEKAIDNEFSGNMIDVCPVGALTDKTFRFKNRVWFTKPLYAHRTCETPNCCGKVTLWNRGEKVLRVTSRADQWNEVQQYDNKPGWICNTCRFHKKEMKDWTIDGVAEFDKSSVITLNKYEEKETPQETMPDVMHRAPRLLFDIHSVSDVNKLKTDL